MRKKAWSRGERISAWALGTAVLAIAAGFIIPEVRQFFRLEKPPQRTEAGTKPQTTSQSSTLADQTAQSNSELPKSVSIKLRKTQEPIQKSSTHVIGNENVAGNNISGDHNVTGNNNQVGPTANAPNGIAIAGGTVIQPTVNNFGKPSSSRHLTDSQKLTLITSLKTIGPQSFYFLSAPDAESTHFGNEVLNVLTSQELGWKILDLPSNWGQAYRQNEGLFIVVSDLQKPPKGAVELQRAFKGVGIDANGMTYPMVAADKFAVYVGVNPASE